MKAMVRGTCLVTGATGYVGGRLIPQLIAANWKVRVLVRHPERIRKAAWHDSVEILAGDASDVSALDQALNGIDVAYFLMHSMNAGPDFEAREKQMAQLFGDVARRNDVGRIVYLGGLVPAGAEDMAMSVHMKSRMEVGRILRTSGVPTLELRAGVILGSGSASFEMLRYLTERLPVMVTPRWVDNRIQPIAIADVLYYLVAAAEVTLNDSRVQEIGGPDVLTYEQMMKRYAKLAGLRRRTVVTIPVLTPKLSSRWVGLVTPVPAAIARPLVDSIRHDAICEQSPQDALIDPPAGGLIRFDEAVRRALVKVKEAHVDTRWSDASVPGAPADPLPSDPEWSGGSIYRDIRSVRTRATAESLWRIVDSIGGDNGWYSWRLAWSVRGWMDRAVGGVGLRRGRRNPYELAIDDACDFWRVEERVPPRLLRLRAEMKLPGLAWLEFAIEDDGDLRVLHQRAIFVPRGLAGQLYWWSVAPFHGRIFQPMITHIVAAAEDLPQRTLTVAR